MADAKQEAEWERTSHLMAWIGSVFGGKAVNPDKINPYRASKPLTPAQRTRDDRAAWLLLDNFFRGKRKCR